MNASAQAAGGGSQGRRVVLVAGGAGYIGSHCVRQLCDRGDEVVVLDNLSTGFAASVEVASRLAELAPAATRWTKYALNHWLRQAGPIFDAALALEFIGFAGPEGKEGIDAFLQKRAPKFPVDTNA